MDNPVRLKDAHQSDQDRELMNEDWSSDPPPPPPIPRSVAAAWMFGLIFFVLVVVPVGVVIYILIDSLITVAPANAGDKKPGTQAIMIGLTALVLGAVGVFLMQWLLLKTVFGRLTAEGESSSPEAATEDDPPEPPPKPPSR